MRFREHQSSAQRSTRMLVVLFIILIASMVVILNAAMVAAWAAGTGGLHFPRYFFAVNTGAVLLYVFGSYIIEVQALSDGGAQLAEQAGGRELLEPKNMHEKRLCNVVMEVAVATGIRPPRIFILEKEDAINAFAAGWSVQDSIIGVTRGTLERLSRDELQGVVAHEFSHIIHGDMRLNMRLMSMVLGLQMLHNLGGTLVATARDTRGRILFGVLLGLGFMAAGWLGWLAGRILSASVSRQREFLADASAVKYTRLTDGIAGALRKIAFQQNAGRDQMQNAKAQALAPLYLNFKSAGKLLATHPPIAQRLKRLGVPSWRFVLADDVQQVKGDEFMANRLVGLSSMAASQRVVAEKWEEEVKYASTALAKDLPSKHSPDLEMSSALEMQQFRAQQRLSLALSAEQVRAALLAFWVLGGSDDQRELWRTQCRNANKKVPVMMLDSVLDLAPSEREPLFERLVTQAEAWEPEQRQELLASARTLQESRNPPVPRDGLRLAVMYYWLRDNKTRAKFAYNALEQVKEPVLILTSLLAKCLEVPDAEKWLQAVCARIKLADAHWMEPDAESLRDAVIKIHKLSLLLTPTLVKVWMHEWEAVAGERSVEAQQRDTDILRLMCALLDCPRPQRLIAWGQEAP